MQEALRRTVAMAEHVRMFEELIFLHHLLELGTRHEEIFSSVLLCPSWRPRGVRNRKLQPRYDFARFVHQRRFARTRRCRNNVDRGHSRFCTCSRAFSISAFIDNPSSVIFMASPAKPEVLDSRVLASRFISCSRKSSFLPTSPP